MDSLAPIMDILAAIRRRFLAFALVAALGTLAALIYAVSLPRLYETTAVIQIETPPITAGPAAGAPDAARALQQIERTEQRLMSRTHLETLITELGLFADRPGASMADKVFWLRQAARIEQVINPAVQWRTDVAPSALRIVVRLPDPEQAAEVANRMVRSALAHNRERREARLKVALDFFASEEQRIGGEIAALEAQIAAYKAAHAGSLPEALVEKRTRLAALAEADLALEQRASRIGRGGGGQSSSAARREIERIEAERATIAERRARLEAALAEAPQVERELADMQRRLSQLETQFNTVTRSRAEAETGQILAESRRADEMEVLEWAQVPTAPVAPSRRKIAAMGAMLSLGAGLGLVLLLEMLRPAIHTAAQMERRLGLRPAVAIPLVASPVRKLRRVIARGAVVALLGLSVPAAGLVLADMDGREVLDLLKGAGRQE